MALRPQDFDFVRELLERHAAMALEAGKEYLVEARLSPVAVERGYGSVEALLDAVRQGIALDLKQTIVEAMDIHETSFFRDWRPFEALRHHVIPALVAARARRRELVFWSAGCAGGQEAWSLAMLVREHFPELAGWRVRVVAGDLSREALARARAGRYGQLEINRGLPASMLVKYFERRGAEWQVRDELRPLVEFREINLGAPPWPGLPPPDVVLLRNVLIYFGAAARRRALGAVRSVLAPDGYLLLGASETPLGTDDAFHRVPLEGACLYQLAREEQRR